MIYDKIEEFEKDIKKLLKRYKSLEADLEILKKYAIEPYFEQKVCNKAFVKIEGMCNEIYDSYKVKKFACKSLKNFGNQSGIRVIFLHDKEKKKIIFIEMYYKGDKENEDRDRIKNRLNTI